MVNRRRRVTVASAMHRDPISKLPVELLSAIFILSCHMEAEEVAPEAEGLRDAVFPCMSFSPVLAATLTAVCKHWCHVALSTPQLWNKIRMNLDDVILPPPAGPKTDGPPIQYPVSRLFIKRSGDCPLDILIDGRDKDWDGSEFDTLGSAGRTPFGEGIHDYIHPFTIDHMHTAIKIILHHLHRVRTLSVMTDRWAPMHQALQILSFSHYAPKVTAVTFAPMLETLVLARCNEYSSFSQEFTPQEYNGPAFLPFGGPKGTPGTPLPSLKNVILCGVHVRWGLLPSILPCPQETRGLRELELSFHCEEVRPTSGEFRVVIERCRNLSKMRVNVSGPLLLPMRPAREGGYRRLDPSEPVMLPYLSDLFLGWGDPFVALDVLTAIEAPAMRTLTLQDSVRHVMPTDDADAVLLYVGASRTAETPNATKPMFPHVESVALRNVRAQRNSFEVLYEKLRDLRQLYLVNTSDSAYEALIPRVPRGMKKCYDNLTCACLKLELLHVAGKQATSALLATMPFMRSLGGGKLLTVELNTETDEEVPSNDFEDEEDEEDDHEDEEEVVFNDPHWVLAE